MPAFSSRLEILPLPGAKELLARDGRLPHVVLLVDQFPKALGGGERVLLKLASCLPQYGFSVSIVTFSMDPESILFSMNLNCPVYILPLQRTFGFGSIRAALTFADFLEREEVRIVQTFFESSDLWGGLVTHFLSDAKLIWSRRDMGILRTRKHQFAYRAFSPLPDRVFAVSEQVRRHIIDVDHLDPSKVSTIYNGLDLHPNDARDTSRGRDNPLHIATVGNIRKVKGHDLFIQAAAIVIEQFPHAHFTIAGDVLEQDYFSELQRSAISLGIENHFSFAGSVSNIEAFLQSVDIFILPSRSEGFSNAIVEAMAAGLPVVATDVGGNAEAIDHNVTGIIVPANNVKALAEAVLRLCSDRQFAERLGSAAQAKMAQHFTSFIMMERTAAEYRSLLYES